MMPYSEVNIKLSDNFMDLNCNDEISPNIISTDALIKNRTVSFNPSPQIYVYKKPEFPNRISAQEVISEYIIACLNVKTKPLESLIDQLKQNDFIEGRIPNISLRGIRLDTNSIEALESILMRIQANVIDAENCVLNEDACVNLCDMIEYYDSAYVLSIGRNTRIGSRGWKALSQLITKSESLEQINLNNMIFTDDIIFPIASSFKKSTSLRIVDLSFCYLYGTRLQNLLFGFCNPSLVEELYLGDNKIGSNDCKAIAEILRTNRRLRVLDLENNPISDSGLTIICSALLETEFTSIQRLQLWNTSITSFSMKMLSFYINKSFYTNNHDTLISLNIGKNKIGDEGILSLKTALSHNKSLLRLGLASTRLSTSGIITLAEIIAENKSLIQVDLRDNNINEAGVIALSSALKHNSTMLKINFNASYKISPEMEADFNKSLDQIKTKCHKNRESAINFLETDENTIENNISPEEIFSNTELQSANFSKLFFNMFSSPWRFTRSKIFNSFNKYEIEITVGASSKLSSSPEDSRSEKEFISSPDLVAQDIDSLPTNLPPIGTSRFLVKKTSLRHRRCASDDLIFNLEHPRAKNILNNSITHSYVKFNVLNNRNDGLSSIPSEPTNINISKHNRSRSYDISSTSSPSIPFKKFLKKRSPNNQNSQ